MHRRTFLQSLCVLAAAAAVGHTPVRSPLVLDRATSVSMTVVSRFDGTLYRMDILYGYAILRPELSVRLVA